MNELSDHDLRDAYRSRNASMANCLDFFSKFLAKLDYYLDKIEDLDETVLASSEELGKEEEEVLSESKRNARASRGKTNKKFW